MENELLKPLDDYYMPELQELVTIAFRSYRTEEDIQKKRIKKKYVIKLVRYYNKRAGFKAYKETL